MADILGKTNEAFESGEVATSFKNPNKKYDDETKSEKNVFYDFDVVVKEIGGLGKYQLLLILMAYWITIPAGFIQVASVFLAATPDYRCTLSPLDDSNLYNLSEKELKTYLLPISTITNDFDPCRRYDYNLSSCVSPSLDCITPRPPPAGFPTIKCDEGNWYDDSVYTKTITTEWDLVCDNALLGTVVQAIYFLGILFSSLIGGNIVDRYGRRPMMMAAALVMIGVGIACAYSPNLATFTALRFLSALFLQAGYIACFVYVMEICGEKWRTLIGIFTQLGFVSGIICLSGFAFKWRDWRDLQFAISLVPLPFVVFWFFIPESPRWLFDQKKNDEGREICEKMATRNGNPLSSTVWNEAAESGRKLKAESGDQTAYSPLELFRRPRMRLVTLNLMFNWFVNALVYYGLSLNAGALAGSDFLNNALNGLVELASYFIVAYCMDRLGRRILLSGCLLIGGVACLGSTVFNQFADDRQAFVNTATAFALIGKMAISGSFAVVYNFTAELYPTVVRSTAVGIGSMAARVGSIITPFTLALQYTIPWLTGVIFGLLSLTAGVLSLFFPETNGRKMPTSLDEAEAFYRGEIVSVDAEKTDGKDAQDDLKL